MGITSLQGGVARPHVVDPQYRLGAELPEQRRCGRRFGAGAHGIQGGPVTPQRLDLPWVWLFWSDRFLMRRECVWPGSG